jgi:DNA-directed RNA polymerase specialized sigma24 family protein
MAEGSRKRWELHREALDRLLIALDPDREAASRQYEVLRRKLIDLFSWQKCETAEELADETLDRLARRVYEGEAIQALERYAFGIARLVIQEDTRSRQYKERALRDFQVLEKSKSNDAQLWEAMARCLKALPEESRKLIESYYSEDRAVLADQLGTTINALRNRALRIREKLFACVFRRRDEL